MGANPDIVLNLTGWRRIGLSGRALGSVVLLLPALRDVMASLSADA